MAWLDPKKIKYNRRTFSTIIGRSIPKDPQKDGLPTTTLFFRIPSYSELNESHRKRVLIALTKVFPGLEHKGTWTSDNQSHTIAKIIIPGGIDDVVIAMKTTYPEAMKRIFGPIASLWSEKLFENAPKYKELTVDDVKAEDIEKFLSQSRSVSETRKEAVASPEKKAKLDKVVGEETAKFLAKMSEAKYRHSIEEFFNKAFAIPFGSPFLTMKRDTVDATFKPLMNATFESFDESRKDWERNYVMNAVAFSPMPWSIKGESPLVYAGEKSPGSFSIKMPWLQFHNAAEFCEKLTTSLGRLLGMELVENAGFKAGKATFKPAAGFQDPNGLDRTWNLAFEGKIDIAAKELSRAYPEMSALCGNEPEKTVLTFVYHAMDSVMGNVEMARGTSEKVASKDNLPEEMKKSLNAFVASCEPHPYRDAEAERRQEQEKKKESMIVENRILAYPRQKVVYVQLLPAEYEKVKGAITEFVHEKGDIRDIMWNENRKFKYFSTNIIRETDDIGGYEKRWMLAKELSDYVKEKTGVEIPVKAPDQFNLEWTVSQPRNECPNIKIRVPRTFAAVDKKLASAFAKAKGEGLSPESRALNSIRKEFDNEESIWEVESNKGNYATLYKAMYRDEMEVLDIVEQVREMVREANEKFGTSLGICEYQREKELDKISDGYVKAWNAAMEKKTEPKQEEIVEAPER